MKSYYASTIISEQDVVNDSYLVVDEGKIVGIKDKPVSANEVENFSDKIIAPGYIDVHTHGALGYEPGSGSLAGFKKWSKFKFEHGVTGFLPSTPSVSYEQLLKAIQDTKEFMKKSYSNVLGLQMEGPFFTSGKKIGAQNKEFIVDFFDDKYQSLITKNSDVIQYLALDPLHESIEEIVKCCKINGIKVSAAHSEILHQDFKRIKSYFDAITHTFNGMVGLHHRQPGLAYTSCMDQNIYSEIICDGFHVSYPMLKLFFDLKGFDRSVLITDSMLAVGLPAGSSYSIGEIEVKVSEEGRVLKSDGGLAGSTLTIDKAVYNLVHKLSIPLEKAVQMASLNPARLLRIDDCKGSIKAGKDADFIVLDQDLNVDATFIMGKNVYGNVE